jgi:hypothetical protein
MKNTFIYTSIFLLFLSCTNQSELSKEFNCSNLKLENNKLYTDFNKNFTISIPKTWNTKLYFDKYSSEIFTADTIKNLTKSFILKTSFNLGQLILDTNFYTKNKASLAKNKFEIINDGTENFKSKQSYWYFVKGVKNGFTYHQFNIFVKISEETYFNATSEIYGEKQVNERICETIAILENIEFLK